MSEVHVSPVQYKVTAWPEDHECHEASLWSLLVTYRGEDRWAVELGWSSGAPKIVLTRSGEWALDQPGEDECRFTLDEALEAASRRAASLQIADRTVAEAMSEHLTRGCDA